MDYTIAQVRGYVAAHERRAAELARIALVQAMDAARLAAIPGADDYIQTRATLLAPPLSPQQQREHDQQQLQRNLAAAGLQLLH